jgi:hypothetical protein
VNITLPFHFGLFFKFEKKEEKQFSHKNLKFKYCEENLFIILPGGLKKRMNVFWITENPKYSTLEMIPFQFIFNVPCINLNFISHGIYNFKII